MEPAVSLVPSRVSVDPHAFGALTDLLRSGPPAVLTGAGLSTDSGIPDYRGSDGVRRVQPMQHADFLRSSDNRRRYWARSFLAWPRFSRALPNPGHQVLARWQRAGVIGTVVTQNVDGLHQAAGTDRVIELHGSLAHVVCRACAAREGRDALQGRLAALNPHLTDEGGALNPDGDVEVSQETVDRFVTATCLRCASDLIQPDVVFFGGSVPPAVVQSVVEVVDDAAALLVLGSSLQVMSGLRFVKRAHQLGIPVAVVTRGPTRGDPWASIHLDARLDDVLPRLERELGPQEPDPGQ